jgi:hypothetical protein
VPRLLQQEKFIFDELVSYVWTHTFVPAVAASRARPTNAALAAGVVKRSGQEAALRKWLGALEAVATQLQVLGRDGHVSTLRHQVGGWVVSDSDAVQQGCPCRAGRMQWVAASYLWCGKFALAHALPQHKHLTPLRIALLLAVRLVGYRTGAAGGDEAHGCADLPLPD